MHLTRWFSGMPVGTVGRGDTAGFAYHRDALFVAGSNLTATKARLLLMASLLALGALPPADDPEHPSDAELAAIREKVAPARRVRSSAPGDRHPGRADAVSGCLRPATFR